MRTSRVAAAAGVNTQTLRYYERRGLLPEPERTLGGHRVYPDEAVTVVQVIKAAQRLGFSLDEVAELLDAGRRHARTHAPRATLQAMATAKLADVRGRIADLEVIADSLRSALDAGCDDLFTCAGSNCCPIPFAAIGALAAGAHSVVTETAPACP